MPGMSATRAAISRFEVYGLDRILERIANGETLRQLAETPELATSRPMINNWLLGAFGNEDPNSPDGQRIRRERRAAYQLAKQASADVLVEDAGEILDAETDPRAAALVINVANLHLDALRKVMSAPPLAAPAAPGQIEDAEVLQLEPGEEA